SDPNQPPVATAQGQMYVETEDDATTSFARRANSGRIAGGGVLEVDPPAVESTSRLLLREPDLATATLIARTINAAFGDSTARVDAPGAVSLAADATAFLTSVDSLSVDPPTAARIIVDGRDGTVVAGGDIRIGTAVVSHHGITLQIGGTSRTPIDGLV